MLGDISVAENIYIACGYTDMRKSIDGLAGIVQQQFHLEPFSNSCLLIKPQTLDFTDFCPIFWYNDSKDFDDVYSDQIEHTARRVSA